MNRGGNRSQGTLFPDDAGIDEKSTRSLLNHLLTESKLYKTGEAYKALLAFIVRMKNFAPFIDCVAKRIGKLKPKRKDARFHSIETMFRLTGGLDAPTTERVIAGLQKSKFISLDAAERVTYREP